MATKWTDAQLAAITSRDKTLLLSAAAGSGKTSTLTERIIRSITDKENPADISKMLIVTFTRASATDLKTKLLAAVSSALADNPSSKHLTRQLIKLGSAKISTIDAFYLSAVKQNFSALGLSSSFRIADDSETGLIAQSALKEVIDTFYDTESDFPALCECFEKIRDTEGVMEKLLLDLYVECMRTPEGVDYLRLCSLAAANDADKDFFDTEYGKLLLEHAHTMLSDYLALYEDILDKMSTDEKLSRAYYDAFSADRLLCVDALNIIEGKYETRSYAELASLFGEYEIPSLKSIGKNATEYSVYCKSVRELFKDDITSLKNEFLSYSQADISVFFKLTAEKLYLLWRVMCEFERIYFEEKKRRNILELTDVKRYALRLFANEDGTPTELARSFSEQFSDIYIDEYQDVDPVQDLIFRCIAKPNNRFMVGDIKQSIYSFRGARPRLFADYRASFAQYGSKEAQDSDCQTIFMSENFRCSKPVIDFTNLVCADIFRACGNSIGYTDEDDLVCAKKEPDGSGAPPKVSVAVFAKNSKKDIADDIDEAALPSPAEAEARYIASEIKRLITTEYKQDGSPIKPADIAVLVRNKSASARIISALTDLGIKTANTESTQYFKNPDVMMMLCILNAIDNPQRDIQLAGAMRSPIFGFTLDELLIINELGERFDSLYDRVCLMAREDGELGARCEGFISTLQKWRSISVSLPIDKLLSRIFASDAFVASGLVCEANAMGEGGNLQRLYEYARTFEAGSFKGLYNFIEFINNVIESGKTIESSSDTSDEDCVTLTTIHKSKGLEFPVCFVAGSASPFNTSAKSSELSFEYGVGAAMTLSDDTGFAYYTSPLKKILDLNADLKGVEEEMRVLYVALTRAKERLYVTGSYSRAVMPNILANAELLSQLRTTYFLTSATCYMDWILPVAMSQSAKQFTKLYCFTTDRLPQEQTEALTEIPSECEQGFNQELFESLKQSFSFKYAYSELNRLPAKLSVSKLSPSILDEADTSVSLFDSEAHISVPDFFLSSPKKASATQRGTATHHFLQFCDFSLLKTSGVDATLEYLKVNGFIPDNTSELVYKDELEALRGSTLLDEILSAEKVIREQRFNVLLPASEFTRNSDFASKLDGERIAVQGVIDLILIDGDGKISLYDYKTDRLTRAELEDDALARDTLTKAHALQLSYYAKAVEMLFGKAPDRVAVFSTHASKPYDVDILPLNMTDIV